MYKRRALLSYHSVEDTHSRMVRVPVYLLWHMSWHIRRELELAWPEAVLVAHPRRRGRKKYCLSNFFRRGTPRNHCDVPLGATHLPDSQTSRSRPRHRCESTRSLHHGNPSYPSVLSR